MFCKGVVLSGTFLAGIKSGLRDFFRLKNQNLALRLVAQSMNSIPSSKVRCCVMMKEVCISIRGIATSVMTSTLLLNSA